MARPRKRKPLTSKPRSRAPRADRKIEWIETNCPVPEGKHVGQKLKLPKFMRDDLRAIYREPGDKRGLVRRAIISRGRKNAKTTECILLLHLCGYEAEDRPNSQLYSTAQSRDQAAIVFSLAAKMVRMSPDLRSVVTVRETTKELVCAELGTKYRALSAEATTAFGLSPVLTLHDELGQVYGREQPRPL